MEIIPLFPTPVTMTNIGRDFTKKELQFFLTDIPMKEEKEGGASNHRSKDYYLFDNFAEELNDIKSFCEFHLKQYLEEIEGVDIDLATLRITQSWLNKTKPQGHQFSHFHNNSYLSGVLYISCLPNDNINFSDRMYGSYNNMEFSKKKATGWNPIGAKVNVKKGDLIIFPSWIPHHVDMNNTDKERISLTFNTFPIGEMGNVIGSRLKL